MHKFDKFVISLVQSDIYDFFMWLVLRYVVLQWKIWNVNKNPIYSNLENINCVFHAYVFLLTVVLNVLKYWCRSGVLPDGVFKVTSSHLKINCRLILVFQYVVNLCWTLPQIKLRKFRSSYPISFIYLYHHVTVSQIYCTLLQIT